MDFKNWEQQAENPYQYWLSKLDQKDKDLIKEIKLRYKTRLNEYAIYEREKYYDMTSLLFNVTAKIEDLEYQYNSIVKNIRYKEPCKGVIRKIDLSKHDKDFQNIIMINDDRFNEFIYSFGIITQGQQWANEMQEMKAIEHLKTFVSLNVIECIVNDFRDYQLNGYKRIEDLPEWKQVLKRLGNRFDTGLKRMPKYTVIHLWMKENTNLLKEVDQSVFREAVKELHKTEMGDMSFDKFTPNLDKTHDYYKDNEMILNEIYKS